MCKFKFFLKALDNLLFPCYNETVTNVLLLEKSAIVSARNHSIEFMTGFNKYGLTLKQDVDFGSRVASTYEHGYIRTIPTAVAVAVGIALSYFAGSVAAVAAAGGAIAAAGGG